MAQPQQPQQDQLQLDKAAYLSELRERVEQSRFKMQKSPLSPPVPVKPEPQRDLTEADFAGLFIYHSTKNPPNHHNPPPPQPNKPLAPVAAAVPNAQHKSPNNNGMLATPSTTQCSSPADPTPASLVRRTPPSLHPGQGRVAAAALLTSALPRDSPPTKPTTAGTRKRPAAVDNNNNVVKVTVTSTGSPTEEHDILTWLAHTGYYDADKRTAALRRWRELAEVEERRRRLVREDLDAGFVPPVTTSPPPVKEKEEEENKKKKEVGKKRAAWDDPEEGDWRDKRPRWRKSSVDRTRRRELDDDYGRLRSPYEGGGGSSNGNNNNRTRPIPSYVPGHDKERRGSQPPLAPSALVSAPKGPKVVEGHSPTASGRTRYFMMKPDEMDRVKESMANGLWITGRTATIALEKAFLEGFRVMLIFSIPGSGDMQGFAEMGSIPDPAIARPESMKRFTGPGSVPFRVRWRATAKMGMGRFADRRNAVPAAAGRRILDARNGDEIDRWTGADMTAALSNMHKYMGCKGSRAWVEGGRA